MIEKTLSSIGRQRMGQVAARTPAPSPVAQLALEHYGSMQSAGPIRALDSRQADATLDAQFNQHLQDLIEVGNPSEQAVARAALKTVTAATLPPKLADDVRRISTALIAYGLPPAPGQALALVGDTVMVHLIENPAGGVALSDIARYAGACFMDEIAHSGNNVEQEISRALAPQQDETDRSRDAMIDRCKHFDRGFAAIYQGYLNDRPQVGNAVLADFNKPATPDSWRKLRIEEYPYGYR